MKTKIQAELSTMLAMEIERVAEHIEAMPEDHEWTTAEMDTLESLRRAALQLTCEIQTVFENIHGR